MKNTIFNNLNIQQTTAVKTTEGRVRVIAGAGSGKTRVLANRYAYLVECIGIDSSNILCLTFTNKAAQEMKTRISKIINSVNTNDYICTIHSLCVKILRREIYRIGFPKNYMIIDTEDSKSLMKQIKNELGLTTPLGKLLSDIHREKKLSDIEYIKYFLPDAVWPAETNESTFLRFIQLQLQYFALDFQDLIYFTLYIFANYPDALEYWQNEFNYIQIDEVQDCSESDWAIINAISAKCENLFIVGDPDQCIYEWRGASPRLFLEFKSDTDVILDENYRSTPNILNVANSIIQNNKNRIEKNLRTNIQSNAIVVHKHSKNESEEGEWITTTINNMIMNGLKPNDFAILYRASYQSRFIEQSLTKKQLPYTIWGGIRFFERKEIKDCLAYLRLIHLKDDLSFIRIANVPSRKFGKIKLDILKQLAKSEKKPLYETLKAHINDKPFNYDLLKDFVDNIEQLTNISQYSSISELLIKTLNTTKLLSIYRNEEDLERLDNIEELKISIRYYEESNVNEEISLEKYLQDIALFTNLDYRKDSSTIKLMTIHQSKGLEFPNVFVIGLTEGIFPNHRTIRERKENGLEEERRLMYVAATRAKQNLFLTESEGYDFRNETSKYPSRFLNEIREDLLKIDGHIDPALISERNTLINKLIMNEENSSENNYSEGAKVVHEMFGEGEIIAVFSEKQSCEVNFSGKKRNIRWKFLRKL